MLTKKEFLKLKKICHLSDIDVTDIWDCVECYKNMIDSNDYHKATIIKYALYIILKQNANNLKILKQTQKAISEVKAYSKLFAYEN